MISLCSKTYICLDQTTGAMKSSTKGLSKSQNKLDINDFLKVLETKTSGKGINYTFKKTGNGIKTYKEVKAALTYFYPKRKVLDDNITTEPLDI